MKPVTYEQSGVSIDRGDDFARSIAARRGPGVAAGIGSFAGVVDLPVAGMRDPVLLSATDGVGTKLLVARDLGRFNTLGIDLVAMNANDLVASGGRPLAFLDYIACGKVDRRILDPLIDGVIEGCRIAECRLVGGETAEMPDVYGPGEFDIAGFCTGIAERDELLPQRDRIAPGDVLFGLPSSGIHSNGLSLARKVCERSDYPELLTPTRIYVREVLTLRAAARVAAIAHVTGGGIVGNVQRILPAGSTARLTWDWPQPSIFDRVRRRGPVAEDEMRRVFNLGIGMVLVVPRRDATAFERAAAAAQIEVRRVGEVVSADGEVVSADGEVVSADGEVGSADGEVGSADGEVGSADGEATKGRSHG